jgi:hypothetical protein
MEIERNEPTSSILFAVGSERRYVTICPRGIHWLTMHSLSFSSTTPIKGTILLVIDDADNVCHIKASVIRCCKPIRANQTGLSRFTFLISALVVVYSRKLFIATSSSQKYPWCTTAEAPFSDGGISPVAITFADGMRILFGKIDHDWQKVINFRRNSPLRG